jgi:hypothetical protein
MTMLCRNLALVMLLAGLAALAAGCGGQATPDVNAAVQTALAQTRAAEGQIAQAVAATLTASAPLDQPTPATATPETAPVSTPEPTLTPTTVQVEISPPATPTAVPPPAPTPVRIAISPVDGDDGNDYVRGSANVNSGRAVLLPGVDQSAVEDTPTFRNAINLRVEVFDTRAGLYDGAGIDSVTFRIIADDGNGDVVWEKVENSAPYCVFGGDDPLCTSIDLRSGAQWPNPFDGQISNNVYLAQIDITPTEGDATQWRWRFLIDSPELAAPEPAPNTARINTISVQNGRYVVDFETFGFTPQLPGQHVHFFFDSVPPEQAGMPGSGPWQLYPAAAGQPGSSPFTLLTVASRPANAAQMCILVANPNHSVIQGTGNCVALP